MEGILLSVEEASEYLGIKKPTLYAWAKCGKIPHFRLNSLLRFKKGDLDHWIEGRKMELLDTENRKGEI
jgi:excisionase family DNA binding protein